jgi:hypothetical protein
MITQLQEGRTMLQHAAEPDIDDIIVSFLILYTLVTKRICRTIIITHEVDEILMVSTVIYRQGLQAMLADKECMATQVTGPSPSTRIG